MVEWSVRSANNGKVVEFSTWKSTKEGEINGVIEGDLLINGVAEP